MSLLRRLFCSHAFVERGTFKRGVWWKVLECEKCFLLKRTELLPMPNLMGGGPQRRTELNLDELREALSRGERR